MDAAPEPFLLLEPEPAPRLEAAPAQLSTAEPIRWLRSPMMTGAAILGIGIPVLWFLIAGESAKVKLDVLRGYLVQYNWVIMCVLFVVLGVKFIGQALPAFFD